jgi:beta-N-acetylhexosaminidase
MVNQAMRRKVSLTFLLVLCAVACFSQSRQRWVDSTFQTLSVEDKIGQVLFLRMSAANPDDRTQMLENIVSFHIGGLIITQGGPLSHSRFANEAQKRSPVPLLFGVEAVRGPGFTMDSIRALTEPLVLNALRSDSLIEASASELARQMNLLQLHINFMPLANSDLSQDVYPDKLLHFGTQPGYRRTAGIFMKAMADRNILSCAQQDVRWSARQQRTELVSQQAPDTSLFRPYQELIALGLPALMTTGLPYFYVEQNKGLPAFVSQLFVTENIQRSLGFAGLTFTDIPSLQKVVAKPRGGETELLAFQVGNDILINPNNLSATVKKIKKSLRKNAPLQQRLDEAVIKILKAKYDAGLSQRKPIDLDNLLIKIHSTQNRLLHQRISRECLTLVTNESGHLPIQSLARKKFAVVSIGMETDNVFSHYLTKYAPVDKFSIRLAEDTVKLKEGFDTYDLVVVASFPLAQNLLPQVMKSINRITGPKAVVHFGDPDLLKWFDSFGTVLAGYTDDPVVQRSAAEMVFGAIQSKGRLPLSVTEAWREGAGSTIDMMDRLSYGLPEEVGISSKTLDRIAAIAREAIDSVATPGCHILVARKGKIVFDRPFGWYTYENQTAVSDETIYDLASVTKVMATLQSVMFLQEKGLIDVHKKVSVYLPELITSNKKDLTLKDMLTHQSGLLPFIPMWPQTLRENSYDPYYYSATRSQGYPLQVAPELFVAPYIGDSAWHWVVQSRLLNKTPRTPFSYRYSDMGSMILQRMSNRLLNEPMDSFLRRYFYEPLGANTLGYNPLERFSPRQIAPTEVDTIYRKSILTGTVHDERAAMLGGVAGHAGLFGNATDLAKMCQMLLNGGSYGGVRFYQPATVEMFANKQYDNSHRGLGWDKPITSDWAGSTSELASPKTFGHTGFTGTCIWIDPEFDLIYIFLSNRVWPARSTKLLRTNVRTRIQTTIYKSIFDYSQFGE